MFDDFSNQYWIQKLYAICRQIYEFYNEVQVKEQKETELLDGMTGLIKDLCQVSKDPKLEEKGNYSKLKSAGESLPCVIVLKQFSEHPTANAVSFETLKEIQELQHELWAVKGKELRLESTLTTDDIGYSLEAKEASKRSLEGAVRSMQTRLHRYSESSILLNHCKRLASCLKSKEALQLEVDCLNYQLAYWNERRKVLDDAGNAQSKPLADTFHRYAHQAISLSEQIQLKLYPKLYALRKCQAPLDRLAVTAAAKKVQNVAQDRIPAEVDEHTLKSTKNYQKAIKHLLRQMLIARKAAILSEMKEQSHDLIKLPSNASFDESRDNANIGNKDSSLKRSYDSAKKELVLLESELITLKKTNSELLKLRKENINGISAASAEIASVEELQNRINDATTKLKQRKGSLAPLVASLKAHRQELQELEISSETMERDGIRSKSKETVQKEAILAREELGDLEAEVVELESKLSTLRELAADFNSEKIRTNVASLKSEIRKLESTRAPIAQVEYVDKIESWKRLSQLLETLCVVQTEASQKNAVPVEIEANSTVLLID